ncbi:hypothetical protein HYH03_001399 [Edaphochlamys debaryana]|uniref:Metallo-beta-lactamase domain-containing protein n=1 Tax=Edaphochlamys debaryana TaxID=47281 RepID=A0A835YF90_9CHLO|nr:hypothetical protein HYH03_001399 [Edaphochlamys debaryana]|eukprot:KAG2500632.1 hypothetical protein HYH03_001399 [Edaphochlamys debaryana]
MSTAQPTSAGATASAPGAVPAAAAPPGPALVPNPDPAVAEAELAAARAAWAALREVDRLTVRVIVDNETDGLSSPCPMCDPQLGPECRTPYVTEFSAGVQRVLAGVDPCLDFRRVAMGGHGLSLLIEAEVAQPPQAQGKGSAAQAGAADGAGAGSGAGAGGVFRVLFDGGPREELWRANAESLGVDLGGVGGAMLSHWHIDHSVGLIEVAKAAAATRAAALGLAAESADDSLLAPPPPFVFDLHPDRPVRRGFMPLPGRPVPLNEDPTYGQLSPPGCVVELHAEPHVMGGPAPGPGPAGPAGPTSGPALGGVFFVSGSIPRRTAFEQGQPGHVQLGSDGTWRPDVFLMDERYMAVKIRGRGAVVFTACSHAGVVNVVESVAEVSQSPVAAVMGGFHLASRPMEQRVPETVAALQRLLPGGLVLAGHCTGWRAKAALAGAFGDRYQPCFVGGTYAFLAPPRLQDKAPA